MILLNELPDTNNVFTLDSFTDAQGYQENFNETMETDSFLNKQANFPVGINLPVENNTVLPSVYEINSKSLKVDKTSTEKKVENNIFGGINVSSDVSALNAPNFQLELSSMQNPNLPLMSSFESSLSENAEVDCITCGATITLRDLETHKCYQKVRHSIVLFTVQNFGWFLDCH